MPQMYEMSCGCKIPIIDPTIKQLDGLPSLDLDFYNLNKNCGHTWGIIDRGLTKGVFQLEKSLGQSWAQKVQPISMTELSALISLIRPGCLEAITETEKGKKNLTQLYVDRKNGVEEIKYIDPCLDAILEETLAILVYQEQAMKIATKVAGFSEQDADSLRKAMGKKDAAVMAKVKQMFLDGVEKCGVISKEVGDELFSWIEKSQRYSFNKSHGVSYAYMGYWSAYVKAHFPLHFYTSWIHFSDKKQKPQIEFAELIRDSKQMGVDVIIPSLFDIDYNPTIMNGKVGIGLRNLKQAGEKKVIALKDSINEAEIIVNKDIRDFSWYEVLYHVCDKLNKNLVENIICCGVMDEFGKHRQEMLHEYKYWNELTKKQREWIREHGNNRLPLYENIDTMLNSGTIRLQTKNKEKLKGVIRLLENPSSSTEDTIEWIARSEQELYGISISCHRVQAYEKNISNCTIQEFLDGYDNKQIVIAAEIKEVRFWSPKDDDTKKIAYLTIEDETGGTPNIVVYDDQVKKYADLLYEGNIVYITGYRQKNRPERLIANKITQL